MRSEIAKSPAVKAASIAGFQAYLAALTDAEAERIALWLPASLGLGIAFYFLLPIEPPYPVTAAGVLSAALVFWILRRGAWRSVASLILAFALGFGLVQARAFMVSAPVLLEQIGPVAVSGRIVDIDARPDGSRLLLENVRIDGIDPQRTPVKIRIVHRRNGTEISPGDRIRVRAILLPPPAPAAPGAFDFQRQAFFERLGGVGFSVGALTREELGEGDGDDWAPSIAAARHHAFQRIVETVPGAAGTIAAALITGEVGAIPADVLTAMRDSGLAHLLSISGLHFGLVTAFLFLLVRQGLALIPFVALRYPIKKWAAVAAFAGACFYLLFSGASIPAQRSFLMVAIVLLAVLLDRTALSMRLVAWAGAVVLLLSPESLLGPSFQMSFAAVIALIATHESMEQRFLAWRMGAGWLRRGGLHLAQICMTTLVAGLATAPFALYHFNRFTAYALAANLVAIPLTSAWIMPFAVLATALMPFGLEYWPLHAMAWGVDGVIFVAEEVASWGGAVSLLPAMPSWGLAAVALGGLWLCVWRRSWRYAGLPVIVLGVSSIALAQLPDILISGDGKLMAVRGTAGDLTVSADRSARIQRESWLRRDGQETAMTWPKAGASADGALICDALSCLYRGQGGIVALVRNVAALAEDCTTAAFVVSLVPTRGRCKASQGVVDRYDLWRNGAHAVWFGDGRWRIESVREIQGLRPWVPPLPSKARQNRRISPTTRP